MQAVFGFHSTHPSHNHNSLWLDMTAMVVLWSLEGKNYEIGWFFRYSHWGKETDQLKACVSAKFINQLLCVLAKFLKMYLRLFEMKFLTLKFLPRIRNEYFFNWPSILNRILNFWFFFTISKFLVQKWLKIHLKNSFNSKNWQTIPDKWFSHSF